jgi:hypothetical protein
MNDGESDAEFVVDMVSVTLTAAGAVVAVVLLTEVSVVIGTVVGTVVTADAVM